MAYYRHCSSQRENVVYSSRSTAWKHRITYVDRPASPFERTYGAAVRVTKHWGHYLLLIPSAAGTFGFGYVLIYSRAGWEAPII
ncbi:MAG TPA: hypothetical protein VLF41_00070, partial [Candidatus Nanoarchaeia archaeon]|nr:hypothetical protein [Candidatus Nanoarchaeia archaeon]